MFGSKARKLSNYFKLEAPEASNPSMSSTQGTIALMCLRSTGIPKDLVSMYI